jgi:hypothetical protein
LTLFFKANGHQNDGRLKQKLMTASTTAYLGDYAAVFCNIRSMLVRVLDRMTTKRKSRSSLVLILGITQFKLFPQMIVYVCGEKEDAVRDIHNTQWTILESRQIHYSFFQLFQEMMSM